MFQVYLCLSSDLTGLKLNIVSLLLQVNSITLLNLDDAFKAEEEGIEKFIACFNIFQELMGGIRVFVEHLVQREVRPFLMDGRSHRPLITRQRGSSEKVFMQCLELGWYAAASSNTEFLKANKNDDMFRVFGRAEQLCNAKVHWCFKDYYFPPICIFQRSSKATKKFQPVPRTFGALKKLFSIIFLSYEH